MRNGIDGIAAELRQAVDCAPILREYGARVGRNATVLGPLHIVNADTDFSRLSIGDHVYIGPDVLIDLADDVTIADYATLSMRTSVITHMDVGPGPLSARRPRQQGPVRIERGAYLGAGVTVLHGVTIGEEATIGAGAFIRKSVAPHETWVAGDARPL